VICSSWVVELLLSSIFSYFFFSIGPMILLLDTSLPPVMGLLLGRSEWNPFSSKRIVLPGLFLAVDGTSSFVSFSVIFLWVYNLLSTIYFPIG